MKMNNSYIKSLKLANHLILKVPSNPHTPHFPAADRETV